MDAKDLDGLNCPAGRSEIVRRAVAWTAESGEVKAFPDLAHGLLAVTS
jgi:hypothetical protein